MNVDNPITVSNNFTTVPRDELSWRNNKTFVTKERVRGFRLVGPCLFNSPVLLTLEDSGRFLESRIEMITVQDTDYAFHGQFMDLTLENCVFDNVADTIVLGENVYCTTWNSCRWKKNNTGGICIATAGSHHTFTNPHIEQCYSLAYYLRGRTTTFGGHIERAGRKDAVIYGQWGDHSFAGTTFGINNYDVWGRKEHRSRVYVYGNENCNITFNDCNFQKIRKGTAFCNSTANIFLYNTWVLGKRYNGLVHPELTPELFVPQKA